MTRKIVVIGGGVVGCSVAWHLAKQGAGEVLVRRGGVEDPLGVVDRGRQGAQVVEGHGVDQEGTGACSSQP